jgi:hypothetical protein
MPRFELIAVPARSHGVGYIRIVVCEKTEDDVPWIDDLGYHIKRVLLDSAPLDAGSEVGIARFTAAERVVAAMNRMHLAFYAAEVSNPGHGVQDVFDYLWSMEKDDEDQSQA